MGGGAYVGQGNFDIGGVGLGGGNGRGGVKGFVDGPVYKVLGVLVKRCKDISEMLYLRLGISGYIKGTFSEGGDDTNFSFGGMIRFEVDILVRVGGLPVDRCGDGVIRGASYTDI